MLCTERNPFTTVFCSVANISANLKAAALKLKLTLSRKTGHGLTKQYLTFRRLWNSGCGSLRHSTNPMPIPPSLGQEKPPSSDVSLLDKTTHEQMFLFCEKVYLNVYI